MSGFDTVIEGVLLGGVYALFALGLSLIFGIMRLVNLAHGDLILLAAYLVLSVTTTLGVPLLASTLLIVVVMFAAGFALQRLVLERVLGDDILPPLLVTFGLSIVIQNGLLLAYGADSRRLQAGAFESSSIALAPGLSIGLAPLTALHLPKRPSVLSRRTWMAPCRSMTFSVSGPLPSSATSTCAGRTVWRDQARRARSSQRG